MVTSYYVCDIEAIHLSILIADVGVANHGTAMLKAGRDTRLDNGNSINQDEPCDDDIDNESDIDVNGTEATILVV